MVLYAHLSDAAITDPRLGELGRLENTRSLITAEQVRAWCANPDTTVVVKPVIDLNDHVHVTQYEVPDRMAEAAALADVTCVFPFCTRPARGCRPGEHDADCDHITAHGTDGADVLGQCRAAVPTPPPVEDPRRVALRAGRARVVPVDLARSGCRSCATTTAPST